MHLSDAKWIFFDMGYTLINEDRVHAGRASAVLGALAASGGPVHTLDEFFALTIKYGSRGSHSPVYRALHELGGSEIPRYAPDNEEVYPDALPTLARLHEKYSIGIIANQRGGSVGRLARSGLLRYIDLVYSSSEIGLHKPNTDFFTSALEAAGCPAEYAVMVGDRPDNDIRPARETGMMTVRIRHGYFREWEPTDEMCLPDADVKNLSDLPALFGLD